MRTNDLDINGGDSINSMISFGESFDKSDKSKNAIDTKVIITSEVMIDD